MFLWGGEEGGVMEQEWVAAFDLLLLHGFEQLSETTKKYVNLEQWKVKTLYKNLSTEMYKGTGDPSHARSCDSCGLRICSSKRNKINKAKVKCALSLSTHTHAWK